MASDRLSTAIGFAGALLVLGALVYAVGLDPILAAVVQAKLWVVGLVLCAAAVWLTAWGLALKTVLRAMGAPIAAHRAVGVFAAAVFANNITPFGQAGGEPVSAVLISQVADTEYETGLAAIASVDTLHFVPSIAYATVGLVFVARNAVSVGRNLYVAGALVVGIAVTLPIAALLAWRFRYEIEAGVVRVFTPVARAAGRLIPWTEPPGPDAIAHRIEGFFTAIDHIAGDRRTLLTALGLSALGWLALVVALWLSLYAIGHAVPFAAVLLVVPVGKIAGLAPLPGGSGAIEWVVATLLVPTAGIPLSVATTAVLIHRGATYWLPLFVGGGVASKLGAERTVVE
jgi:uncharacterized protein (TIRG00374 family)